MNQLEAFIVKELQEVQCICLLEQLLNKNCHKKHQKLYN